MSMAAVAVNDGCSSRGVPGVVGKFEVVGLVSPDEPVLLEPDRGFGPVGRRPPRNVSLLARCSAVDSGAAPCRETTRDGLSVDIRVQSPATYTHPGGPA